MEGGEELGDVAWHGEFDASLWVVVLPEEVDDKIVGALTVVGNGVLGC